jgi:hypothetical protein
LPDHPLREISISPLPLMCHAMAPVPNGADGVRQAPAFLMFVPFAYGPKTARSAIDHEDRGFDPRRRWRAAARSRPVRSLWMFCPPDSRSACMVTGGVVSTHRFRR